MSSDKYKGYCYNSFFIEVYCINRQYEGEAKHPCCKTPIQVKNFPFEKMLFSELERLVDKEVTKNLSFYQKQIKIKHKKVMQKAGYNYQGVGRIQIKHRENHCYKCNQHCLDNRYDLECKSCGWIICSNCGSCKCGYTGAKAF